jgi:hypothetical protein
MSDEKLKDARAVIYPYNIKKAGELLDALRMKSYTEMVNYLIEAAEAQQLTKISFTDQHSKKSFSIIRSSVKYDPKDL